MVKRKKEKVRSPRWGGYRPGAGRKKLSEVEKCIRGTGKKMPSDIGLLREEISHIITLCQAKGVSRLKLSGLELDFFNPIATGDPKLQGIDQNVSNFESKKSDFALSDPNTLTDLQLSQQMIDDPVSFEQEIIDSHIRGQGNG